ncbi:hypothetical protein [Streptomyces sp. P17]|uniref:hypothetical protein n=1 Tax=Streptomyces sp. P17 TaxID=3074716 RepID=UPI0028F45277|nr:hypothetical protein [Streptomyces sp. P17]MDT9701705.1 hypothetical protein [Streptomyces sp. P17]
MTRPTLRMCARCQRTTEEPVLVHEVHASTGPGFNVYACPECAVHYPPMPDVLEVLESAGRRSRCADKIDTEAVETGGRYEAETTTGERMP